MMDIKTPSSNESDKNLYDNIEKLETKDQLKFVIGSKADFEKNNYPIKGKSKESLTFFICPFRLPKGACAVALANAH
jgi:hypothetical protein